MALSSRMKVVLAGVLVLIVIALITASVDPALLGLASSSSPLSNSLNVPGPLRAGCCGAQFIASGLGAQGCVFTPQTSGNVKVTFSGTVANDGVQSSGVGTIELFACYGSGTTPPANNVPLQNPAYSGVTFVSASSFPNAYFSNMASTANTSYNFTITFVASNLPLGKTTYFDLGIKTRGGTGSLTNVNYLATEL